MQLLDYLLVDARKVPQPFGIGGVERVRRDSARARSAAPVDDPGLVAVLEVAAADAVEQRRRRQQRRRRGALLDGLEVRASCLERLERPARRSRREVALQRGAMPPGISALATMPSAAQRRVASTANSTLAVLDWPYAPNGS